MHRILRNLKKHLKSLLFSIQFNCEHLYGTLSDNLAYSIFYSQILETRKMCGLENKIKLIFANIKEKKSFWALGEGAKTVLAHTPTGPNELKQRISRQYWA